MCGGSRRDAYSWRLATDEPAALQALLEDVAVQGMLIRLRVDIACIPQRALELCEPSVVERMSRLRATRRVPASADDVDDALVDPERAKEETLSEQLRRLTARAEVLAAELV